jgi:hypothetical protein
MWQWKRVEKIIWTDRVKIEEVLPRISDEINIVYTVKNKRGNCFPHLA